jgi:hypothetical protein
MGSNSTMNNDLEKELMQSLRYASGLDREKLSELVRLATKLFDSIRKPKAGSDSSKAATQYGNYEWWWIYGIPIIEGIAFETVLEHKQVQELISAVSTMSDVKAVMNSLDLTPDGVVQEPEPSPWKVKGAFGARHSPGSIRAFDPKPDLPG